MSKRRIRSDLSQALLLNISAVCIVFTCVDSVLFIRRVWQESLVQLTHVAYCSESAFPAPLESGSPL